MGHNLRKMNSIINLLTFVYYNKLIVSVRRHHSTLLVLFKFTKENSQVSKK